MSLESFKNYATVCLQLTYNNFFAFQHFQHLFISNNYFQLLFWYFSWLLNYCACLVPSIVTGLYIRWMSNIFCRKWTRAQANQSRISEWKHKGNLEDEKVSEYAFINFSEVSGFHCLQFALLRWCWLTNVSKLCRETR